MQEVDKTAALWYALPYTKYKADNVPGPGDIVITGGAMGEVAAGTARAAVTVTIKNAGNIDLYIKVPQCVAKEETDGAQFRSSLEDGHEDIFLSAHSSYEITYYLENPTTTASYPQPISRTYELDAYFFDNPIKSTGTFTYSVSATLTGAAAPVERPSGWAKADVANALAAGLVPAGLQGKYTQATTRAEFCALAVQLYETAVGKEITDRKTFSDTEDVNVQKMAALKVVNGVGGGKFDPDGTLTREQAAAMLSRLASATGKPLADHVSTFADTDRVSSYAQAAVGQMQASKVMGGVGQNTFDPTGSYTREQSIITMGRLYALVK